GVTPNTIGLGARIKMVGGPMAGVPTDVGDALIPS
ncbi:hypothetical protein A2U01_0081336, partial [Trifolium medium]|nr:hypothetical protein [Trifolium medium]